ncbi:MAG: YafY family protein [Candidatus Sericytochromatia bacterium]
MNKTDRLLAIVLELEVKKLQTAEQLAKKFEVSKRTIYRDIDSLCQSGVPIISKQGEGYSLVKGYFLPPISFSLHEANILLLGVNFVKNSFDADYQKISENVENKIKINLSKDLEEKVLKLKDKFNLFNLLEDNKQKSFLQIIRTAILENKNLVFDYFSKTDFTNRKVSPHKLAHLNNTWYLTAFCHKRNDIRNFRIERIDNLVALDEVFSDSIFNEFQGYKDTRDKTCRLSFKIELERWLKEDNFYYIEKIIRHKDFLELILKYRNEEEIIPWILSWHNNIKVLEPLALKDKVILALKKTLEQY